MRIISLLEHLSSASPILLPLLLDAALKGAAILLLTALAALVMRRSSAAARHWIWFLGVLGVLTVPMLSLALPQWHILPRWAMNVPAATRTNGSQTVAPTIAPAPAIALPLLHPAILPDTASPPENPAAAPTPPSPAPAPALGFPVFPWQTWTLLAWLTGSALVLAYIASGFLSLAWLQHGSQPVTHGPWPALLRQLSAQQSLCRPVRLLSSPRRTMPMTWGLWRPRILLPDNGNVWTDEQRRTVLLHELAHIRRRDCLTQCLTQLACAIYWFNPLLWLAWRQMQAERERACDDLVLAAGAKASAYAEQLLHLATALPPGPFAIAAIAMARPSKLEGRLRAILDTTRNRRAVTWTAAVVTVLLMGAFVVPVAMLGAADEAAPLSPKPSSAAPATQPAQTRGRVVDIHNQPIAGAELHMNNSPWSAVSDTEGWFPLPDSEIGASLRLRVGARGFVERNSVYLQRLESGKLNPAGGVIQLDRAGRLEGRVIGPAGKPLAAASLLMFTYSREGFAGGTSYGTSDAQGHFVIEHVPPGTLVLYSSPAKEIGAVKLLQLRDGQVIRGLVLDLSKSIATGDGRVVDRNGRPLAGVNVSLGWQAKGASAPIGDVWSATTDHQGRYRLDKLPQGQWIFVASVGTASVVSAPVNLSDTPAHVPDLVLPVVLTASGRLRRVPPMDTSQAVHEWIDATLAGDTEGVAAVVAAQSPFARGSGRIVSILTQIKTFPQYSMASTGTGEATTNAVDLSNGTRTQLTFKLIQQTGQWRISDVVDEKGRSLVADSSALPPSATTQSAMAPATTQATATPAAHPRTVTFTCTIPTPGQPAQPAKQMIKGGRSRTELSDGRMLIEDAVQHKRLYIEPEQKTATLSTQPHLVITDIQKLTDPGLAPVTALGDKQVAGRQTEGIRFTVGAETRTVWRDPTTHRPVRIEIRAINPLTHQPLHAIFSDIVFDAPLDDALFALKAPEGYELRKSPVPIKVENLPTTEPTTQLATTQPVASATLDFRIAAEIGEGDTPQGNRLPRKMAEHLVASLQKQGPAAKASRPPGFDWFAADDQAYPHRFITGRHGGQRYILLMTQAPYVMLAGKPGQHTWGLKRAYLDQDGEGQTAIGFELDAVGAERLGKLTESNLDRPLAMLIDGKVISAPTIRSKITHTAMIAGGLDGFDPAWARQAAEALTQGMPPAPSPTTAPNER